MKKLLKIFLISALCACYVDTQIYAGMSYASIVPFQESHVLSDLINSFKKYKTTNTDFHAGNLYEHSAWVALAINEWFENSDEWVEGLSQNDKKLAMLAGLLHDVGKAGDLEFSFYTKPGHELKGLEYVLGKKTFYLSKKQTFNFGSFFKRLGLTGDDKKLVAILIGVHNELGELLKNLPEDPEALNNIFLFRPQIDLFIQKIKSILTLAEYKKALNSRLLKLIILICAADIKGSGRVDLKHSVKIFNFIIKFSPAVVHKDAPDSFSRFGYHTRGKKIRAFLSEFIK